MGVRRRTAAATSAAFPSVRSRITVSSEDGDVAWLARLALRLGHPERRALVLLAESLLLEAYIASQELADASSVAGSVIGPVS